MGHRAPALETSASGETEDPFDITLEQMPITVADVTPGERDKILDIEEIISATSPEANNGHLQPFENYSLSGDSYSYTFIRSAADMGVLGASPQRYLRALS